MKAGQGALQLFKQMERMSKERLTLDLFEVEREGKETKVEMDRCSEGCDVGAKTNRRVRGMYRVQ